MSTTTFEGEVSRRLREDAMEITRSLEEFMNNRVEVLGQQQDAMGRFDMEMAQIAGEFEEKDEDGAPKVDHNVMRHLNITKKAAESEDYHEFERLREVSETQSIYGMHPWDPNYVDEPEKQEFDKGLVPKAPMPDQSQKAFLREKLFSLMDDSRMEETTLELEYDKVREEVGAYKAEYLAEGLLTTQKTNYKKLTNMFGEYQPAGFGKAWGNDPDYIKMAEDLKAKLAHLDGEEASRKKGTKPKKKKTKKSGH